MKKRNELIYKFVIMFVLSIIVFWVQSIRTFGLLLIVMPWPLEILTVSATFTGNVISTFIFQFTCMAIGWKYFVDQVSVYRCVNKNKGMTMGGFKAEYNQLCDLARAREKWLFSLLRTSGVDDKILDIMVADKLYARKR